MSTPDRKKQLDPFLEKSAEQMPEVLKSLRDKRRAAFMELLDTASNIVTQMVGDPPTVYWPLLMPNREMDIEEWQIHVKKETGTRKTKIYIDWHPEDAKKSKTASGRLEYKTSTIELIRATARSLTQLLVKTTDAPSLPGQIIFSPDIPLQIQKNDLALIQEKIAGLVAAHNEYIQELNALGK
jgi:hypothetical protein